MKVFICRDNSENRKKILKIVDPPKDIMFGNGEISYAKLKTIKEFISNQILQDRDKYDYIIGCAITSKEIKITMSGNVKKSQIKFVKRLVVAFVFFLLPTLMAFAMGIMDVIYNGGNFDCLILN